MGSLALLAATCSKLGNSSTATTTVAEMDQKSMMETSEIVDQGIQHRPEDDHFGLVATTTDQTDGNASTTAANYVNVTVDGQEAIFIPISGTSGELIRHFMAWYGMLLS